jgi:hypothetical protein
MRIRNGRPRPPIAFLASAESVYATTYWPLSLATTGGSAGRLQKSSPGRQFVFVDTS